MNKLNVKSDITWDEYFMGIAILSAKRSKDPNTKVGCCIVDNNHRILSMGYNGTPNAIKDEDFMWDREGDFLNTKYPYVIHSEANAILNFKGHKNELNNATMYVTLFPCNECAKFIAQTGINTIIYLNDKYADTDGTKASKKILDMCNIKYISFNDVTKNKPIKKIEINFN